MVKSSIDPELIEDICSFILLTGNLFNPTYPAHFYDELDLDKFHMDDNHAVPAAPLKIVRQKALQRLLLCEEGKSLSPT